MKKVLFLLMALAITSLSFAQAPQGINYQGVARNNIGAAISKQNIGVQFKILQSSTPVYIETHPATTDTFGLYSLVIGQGATSLGTFSAINWGSGNYSIEVDIDPLGGSAYQFVATSQLQSVPYALYSGGSSAGVTSVTGNPTQIVATGSTSVSLDLATVPTVTAGIYGSSTTVPQITVDQYGRVTGVLDIAIPSPAAQTLSLSSNILSISGGNAVTLPTPTATVAVALPLSGDGSSSNPITMPAPGVTTTVTVSSPLKIAGSVSSPSINITPANATNSGYLDSTDWVTFNNKISSILPGTGITTVTAGGTVTINASATSLPTPTVGSLLYSNPSNTWTATNPSFISSDGNSITVVNTTTVGTAGTFSVNGAGSNAPALQVTSNSSTGYGLKVDNLGNGAAIVANSTGPYAIEGNMSGGSGDAVVGQVENNSNGNAIHGYIDATSTGSAGNFTNINPNNSSPVINVSTNGTGNAGLFQITNTTSAAYVLNATTVGNGIVGNFDINNSSNNNPVLNAGTNGLGNAGVFQITNTVSAAYVLNATTLGMGIAGNFDINNPSNNSPALNAGTNGTGFSGKFSGGAGLQTDKIQITNGATNGAVLTSDINGNGTWQSPSGVTSIISGMGITTTSVGGAVTVSAMNGSNIWNANELQNVSISTVTPTTNQVLEYNGSQWAPGNVGTVTSVTGAAPGLSGVVTTSGVISANNTAALWNANELVGVSISTVTPTTGQILQYNSSQWVAAPPPVAGASNGLSVTTGSVVLGGTLTNNTIISQVANNMTYSATTGNFQISNANTTNALAVTNSGTGEAGLFQITNSGNNQAALVATTNGGGDAGFFQVTNASNGGNAIAATTNGTGAAIGANNTGSGSAITASNSGGNTISAQNTGTTASSGIFQNTNTGNSFPTLNVITNSTSGGPAIFAQTSAGSNGNAINAVNNGAGGSAGQFQINNVGNGATVLNVTTSGGGQGISVTTLAGTAVSATSSGSNPSINITNSGTGGALYAVTTGTAGSAGSFANNSTSNSASAVDVSTSGNGPAIYAINNYNGNGSVIEAVITTAGNSGTALFASTSGTGIAGNFVISNASSSSSAVSANSNGSAGAAVLGNSSGGASAIYGTSNGTGYAGYFQTNNASNTLPAIEGTTNGSGPAVEGITTGTGNAASFSINNAGNSQPAVVVNNNGSGSSISATTGGNGTTIQASTIGTGNSGSFSGGAGLKTDGMTVSIVNLSTPTTLTGINYFVEVTANTTITLPLASANQGRIYIFINPSTAFTLASQAGGGGIVSTTGVTLAPAGSSTLIATGTSTHLISDGTNWREW
jgi:hypothetical protein